MSMLKLKLIKKIESKVVLFKLLVLVKAEVEAGEEDVMKDVLLKDVDCKAVLLQVGLLEGCSSGS